MSVRSALVATSLLFSIGCGGSTSPHVDAAHDAPATNDADTHDADTHDADTHDADTHDASDDAATNVVSCDRRSLSCRVAEPMCPENQVPQIIDHCFGPCVPIEQCVCTEGAACPHEEMYTCHMYRQRCGPYVN